MRRYELTYEHRDKIRPYFEIPNIKSNCKRYNPDIEKRSFLARFTFSLRRLEYTLQMFL